MANIAQNCIIPVLFYLKNTCQPKTMTLFDMQEILEHLFKALLILEENVTP